MIHLDTHVVVWLYMKRLDKFPKSLLTSFENEQLVYSPMIKLELQYLYEIKRIIVEPDEILATLNNEINLRPSTANFSHIIDNALTIRWTRDAFDRLITANAVIDEAQLATKDQNIQAHFPQAVWG